MTTGEKLLNLTAEYQASLAARDSQYDKFGGEPLGREPLEIAADYEATLLELLARTP